MKTAIEMNEPGKSIDRIREEAGRRLDELAPLVEEAERLQQVLAALDPEAQGVADLDPHSGIPADRSGHVRADKGVILSVIAENPGITAAEIARQKGMKRTVVATTIARMKRHGELVPEGTGARLPDSA